MRVAIKTVQFALSLLNAPPFKELLPAGIRNRAYMLFINQLTAEAIEETRPERILETKPLYCFPESDLKVWTLTTRKDRLMSLWGLKSLLSQKERWDVWIAGDDGLDKETAELFGYHLPGARVLSGALLDDNAKGKLAQYPLCQNLRFVRRHPLARKLFDPVINLPPKLFLLLDSDVLFFEAPSRVLSSLREAGQGNIQNAFLAEGSNVNSGLAVVNPKTISFAKIEKLLSQMSISQQRGWTVEQDLYSLLSADGWTALPPEYAVQPISDEAHEYVTTCHYIGVQRHKFYSQGVRRLITAGFIERVARCDSERSRS
jgi:hypothetical protein